MDHHEIKDEIMQRNKLELQMQKDHKKKNQMRHLKEKNPSQYYYHKYSYKVA